MSRPLLIESKTFDEAYVKLLEALVEGDECSPRGLETRERLNTTFWVENPRTRILSNPGRRWNPFYAVAELVWQFRGTPDPTFLGRYAKWWTTEQGNVWARASCYGAKLFGATATKASQFDLVSELLRRDPDTRRAVFTILDNEEISGEDKVGVPCTVSLQTVVRENRLHMHAMMRSNDAYRGLPYDVFFFTVVQELLAVGLGVELGSYAHTAVSAHIYEADIAMVEKCLDGPDSLGCEMWPLSAGLTVDSIGNPEASDQDSRGLAADLYSVLRVAESDNRLAALQSTHIQDPCLRSAVLRYLEPTLVGKATCASSE